MNRALENLNASLLKDLEKLMVGKDDFEAATVSEDKPVGYPPAAAPRPQEAPVGAAAFSRRRDPQLAERAQDMRLDLDKFEGRGIEEQAVKELNDMVSLE